SGRGTWWGRGTRAAARRRAAPCATRAGARTAGGNRSSPGASAPAATRRRCSTSRTRARSGPRAHSTWRRCSTPRPERCCRCSRRCSPGSPRAGRWTGDEYRQARAPGPPARGFARAWFAWSKLRATLRWLKYVALYDDWLDYVVRKVERKSGVTMELTERERRWPLLFLWPRALRFITRRPRRSP